MTVHFYDRERKELVHIKAAIYLPGVKDLVPHRIVQDVTKEEKICFDTNRYELSYIGY